MKSFLFYHATSQASVVIITIALMLFIGYLYTIYMPFVILRALSACIWERKGKKGEHDV